MGYILLFYNTTMKPNSMTQKAGIITLQDERMLQHISKSYLNIQTCSVQQRKHWGTRVLLLSFH